MTAEVCRSQTDLWFCTLLRDIYACIGTYYVRPNIFGEKNWKNPPPEIRSRDGHVEYVCKISGSISWKRRGHSNFCAGNMSILRSCLKSLGFSAGSSFCVMFYLILNIGRSDLRMLAWNVLPAVDSFRKKMKNSFSNGNARPFLAFSMACGRWGHVFATIANPTTWKKVAMSCHPLLLGVSMIPNTWYGTFG